MKITFEKSVNFGNHQRHLCVTEEIHGNMGAHNMMNLLVHALKAMGYDYKWLLEGIESMAQSTQQKIGEPRPANRPINLERGLDNA